MITYLVEIQGYDPVAALVKTLYFCSVPFNPFPGTDASRPNQYYQARIAEMGPVPRYLYGSARTHGRSSMDGGWITVNNGDNALDYLIDWGFDGRLINYYRGTIGQAFNTFEKTLTGTMDMPEFSFSKGDFSQIKFIVRDKWAIFDKPLSASVYAGTNSGSTGNEGTVDDIKGKGKPFAIGAVFNVTAAPVNAPGLRFQLHDGAINDCNGCYIGGVAQTKVVAPPGAAQYSIDTTTGIATLGSSPGGDEVTFDVQGAKFSATYYNKTADLISQVAQIYGGLISGEVNSSSVTALNVLNSAIVGLYYQDASQVKITQVIDDLLNCIGAYAYFDKAGVLQLGRLSDPIDMTSIKTFAERDFDEFEIVQSSDDEKGIPTFKVTVNHTVNYTKQTKVAGAVTEARKAWLEKETRSESALDNMVKTVHPLATEVTRDTYLTVASDAATEANRELTLRKFTRRFYRGIVDFGLNSALNLADCITIKQSRFGMSAGKKFVITGLIPHAPDDNKLTLEIWG